MQSSRFSLVIYTTFLVSLGVLLYRVFSLAIIDPYYVGDTGALIHWSKNIAKCYTEGVFYKCPRPGAFPLLQQIPAIIMHWTDNAGFIMRFLAGASTIAFAGMLGAVGWLFRKKLKTYYLLFLLFVFTGPTLTFSRSSFGEMLASFWGVLAVVLILKRSHWIPIAGSIILTCFTKDFAVAFIFGMSLIALCPDLFMKPSRVREQIKGVLIGCFLGYAIFALFNITRFGRIYNRGYLSKEYKVESFQTFLEFFTGQWLAPNSGMLFTWTTFALVFFWFVAKYVRIGVIKKSIESLLALVFKKKFKIHRTIVPVFPAIGGIGVLFILTLGLSKWWSPFGWICWGHRLMLPWVLPLIVIWIHFYAEVLKRFFSQLLTLRWLLVLLAVLFSGLAGFYANEHPHHYANQIIRNTKMCPETPIIEDDKPYYFKCIQEKMWYPEMFILKDVVLENVKTKKAWYGLFYILFVLSSLWIIRTESRKT